MKASQHIGERIRLLRMKKGLSQEQLALQAGMNTSYLGQIERGEKNPTINTLEKIASGLQLSLSSLIIGEEDVRAHEGNAILTVLTPDALKKLIVDTIRSVENTSPESPKCGESKKNK